jgi:hypothetical protein
MDRRVPIVADKLKELLSPEVAERMAFEIVKALDDDGGIPEETTISTPPGGGGGAVQSESGLDEKKDETIVSKEAATPIIRRRWSPINEELVRAVIEVIQKELSTQPKSKA